MDTLDMKSFFAAIMLIIFIDCYRVGCSGIKISLFSVAKNTQLASETCQEMTGNSGLVSRLRCAGTCTVRPSCQGFSFTCTDRDTASCRCFVCSTADIGTASSVSGAVTGILRMQESFHPAIFGVSASPTPTSTTTQTTTTVVSSPACQSPPLIDRTTVKHTLTASHAVAEYSCSVSTDVYVRGTTIVTCTSGSNWPVASILCAPTTCWYTHHQWGPVYKGTLSNTSVTDCQPWALNTPQTKDPKYDVDTMYPSDKDKTEASNFCRVFNDGYANPWCYENRTSGFAGLGAIPLRHWGDCDVDLCSAVPGQRSP